MTLHNLSEYIMRGIKLLFATIVLILSLRFTCEFKRATKLNTKRFTLNTAFKTKFKSENADFPIFLFWLLF